MSAVIDVSSRTGRSPAGHSHTAPDHTHDHAQCQADAMERAEALCAGRGVRLTDIRRRVLECLWQSHRPTSAYDILHHLNENQFNEAGGGDPDRKPLAPPAVYRALEFLLEQGLVHRLASLNAFVGCVHPEREHGAQFYICRVCRAVTEVRDADLTAGIRRIADSLGFAIQAPMVEVNGLCAACQESNTGEG